MQTLLLPAASSAVLPATLHLTHRHLIPRPNSLSFPTHPPTQSLPLTDPFAISPRKGLKFVSLVKVRASSSSPVFTSFGSSPPPNGGPDKAKLAQVAKRLESTSRYFKRLGNLGFWGQLICTIVAAVILSFSVIFTGKISSPTTFYATAGGIAAAFISVFWSFGYIRLSEKLRKTANDPSKAPSRPDVVRSLKNGIILNLLGMGAAILGMQSTVGVLVAKALTSTANPYYQGISPSSSPVLALDVFLVQASANTILSHFLGLVSSLELLRSVTLPPSESFPIPRAA